MKYLLIASLFLLFTTCNEVNKEKDTNNMTKEQYTSAIENLIDFFDKNAYDSDLKTYYSEIDNTGKRVSEKIYTVALSRLIYALSYSSQIYPQNLQKAQNAANFQLSNMIGNDSVGKYFISNIEGAVKDSSEDLDIWQQAYGLCGLSELYRNTSDSALLKEIHELHDAFIIRFKDKKNGGFYGNYNMQTGQIPGSKSLQSLMYPITSYMANLWLADSANRDKYEPVILENLSIIDSVARNEESNWVNVKFDDQWKVCEHENPEKTCFTVTPGHNFQLASLYLRTKTWPFISQNKREEYAKKGRLIIANTLKNPVISESINNGFCSEVNPVTNTIVNQQKDWWQHCEAILALSMLQPEYKQEMLALEEFFFANFTDTINGGEYFHINADNIPVTNAPKGSIGKSAYHTVEMIRFILENQNY